MFFEEAIIPGFTEVVPELAITGEIAKIVHKPAVSGVLNRVFMAYWIFNIAVLETATMLKYYDYVKTASVLPHIFYCVEI
jgi:hypothetical protein